MKSENYKRRGFNLSQVSIEIEVILEFKMLLYVTCKIILALLGFHTFFTTSSFPRCVCDFSMLFLGGISESLILGNL